LYPGHIAYCFEQSVMALPRDSEEEWAEKLRQIHHECSAAQTAYYSVRSRLQAVIDDSAAKKEFSSWQPQSTPARGTLGIRDEAISALRRKAGLLISQAREQGMAELTNQLHGAHPAAHAHIKRLIGIAERGFTANFSTESPFLDANLERAADALCRRHLGGLNGAEATPATADGGLRDAAATSSDRDLAIVKSVVVSEQSEFRKNASGFAPYAARLVNRLGVATVSLARQGNLRKKDVNRQFVAKEVARIVNDFDSHIVRALECNVTDRLMADHGQVRALGTLLPLAGKLLSNASPWELVPQDWQERILSDFHQALLQQLSQKKAAR
jgi:hypothetical protein